MARPTIRKKTKKWFDQVCINLRKKVKISANKKHALPNQLNIDQHKDLLKEYKRLCRYKQIEFWNKETERIKEEEENIWEIWKTLGESNAQIEHLNADGKMWEEYFTGLYN